MKLENWSEFNKERHNWILEYNEEEQRKKLLEYATSFHQIISDIQLRYTPSDTKDTMEEMLSEFQENIEKGNYIKQKDIIEKLITHINHTDEKGDIKFQAGISNLNDNLYICH